MIDEDGSENSINTPISAASIDGYSGSEKRHVGHDVPLLHIIILNNILGD